MSERERWIVYPLLFLALGAALRDKLLKQTKAEQIVCERLILVDNENQPTAVLLGDSNTQLTAAEVEMARSGGARIVAGFVRSGLVESDTFSQRGKRLAPQAAPSRRQPGRTLQLPLQELLRLVPQLRSVVPNNIPVGPASGETDVPPEPAPPGAPPAAEGPALQPPAVEPGGGA